MHTYIYIYVCVCVCVDRFFRACFLMIVWRKMYEDFVNAHVEAVVEYIPTKQRAKPRV